MSLGQLAVFPQIKLLTNFLARSWNMHIEIKTRKFRYGQLNFATYTELQFNSWISWVGSNFAGCFCLSLVANKLSWNVWAVCVRWFVLNFVISVEEFQGGCILSSICDNMFSDKYNSRANPCNLFGMLQKTEQFFVKPNYLWYFLETQCWGVKRRGTCPLPSVPRGYQISWYRVNPIIGQVTKKINLNSPLDTFNTMKRFDFFYTFDSFGRCLQIHKNWLIYHAYILYFFSATSKYFTFLFYIFKESLLCWGQTETVCS